MIGNPKHHGGNIIITITTYSLGNTPHVSTELTYWDIFKHKDGTTEHVP